MHGARAALIKPAAKPRPVQIKVVAQCIEQRHPGIIDLHRNRSLVEDERY
jgi:hypothetical protein